MARLLVVSRSMALALRLADTHDVVEAPAGALADLRPSPDLDAVVLDVGEPALAIQAIDRLRRDGFTTPLLVVSGYQAAWSGLSAVEIPGVVVVPLPVTRAALLEGIDRLLAGARDDVRTTLPGTTLPGTTLPGTTLPSTTLPGSARSRAAAPGGWQTGSFDWWDGPDRDLASPPAPPIPAQAPPPETARNPDPPAAGPTAPELMPLLSALMDRADQLLTVTDAARAAADGLAASARATACAILVAEAAGWRVAGGHGLRATERRSVLPGSHWLAETVLSAGRPVVLDGTDTLRRQHGAVPLAAWRYRVAAPLPGLRALALLARGRDERSFRPPDLQALTAALPAAARELQTALLARELARRLTPLAADPGHLADPGDTAP